LQQPVHHQARDDEDNERVVRRDLFAEERVRTGLDQQPRLAAREVALAQQQVVERLTAIQLSSPPTAAARRQASTMERISGSPLRSLSSTDAYPPTPARAPTHRNSWPVLPKMTLNPIVYTANSAPTMITPIIVRESP
jgi:hypothetical protein